jgi:acetyl esterase/lipase
MYFTLALLAATVRAQQLDPIPIWPSGKPLPGEGSFNCGPEALINSTNAFNWGRRYYNVSIPTLTPFLVSNGTGAAIVIAPGGGYEHLAWDDEGLRVAARFNEMGVSALVLKYRVPLRPDAAGMPWASVPLMDAQRAMGVARENARAWGFNASRLGFVGFSAGGHLSAHLATNNAARLYPRQDAADDNSCRPDVSLLIYPWMLLSGNNKSSTALSPWLNVSAATPPSFLVNNMDDSTAWPENSLMYVRALHLAGAEKPVVHVRPSPRPPRARAPALPARGPPP